MIRPGMECVLDVLRGQADRREVALSEWQRAFRIAEEENVLPLFLQRLRQSAISIPDPVQDDLSRNESEAARTSFWWTSELKGILQALALEAIPVIPLKGPMLADRIYGGVNLRSSRDLDLLVHPQDIPAASSVLEKLEFAKASRVGHHTHWLRGTTLVELHHDVGNPRVFDFDTALAWKRAKPREFLGQPVWQFASSDELLFLCIHSARHQFEYLSHVIDVALALNSLTPEIDPNDYVHGPAPRLGHLIVLGSAVARLFDPDCKPDIHIHESAEITAHMENVAAKRWSSLLERASPQWTTGDRLRFYFETEAVTSGGLVRCARYSFLIAKTLSDVDFDFAARYGIKHRAMVWILRQLRLLAALFGHDLRQTARPRVRQ